MEHHPYENISDKEFEDLVKEIGLLLVTVTDIETDTLLVHLEPLPNRKKHLRWYHKNETYTFGKFGSYSTSHLRISKAGQTGRDSSIASLMEAISVLKPRAIIMIGIAFGVSNKQKIGTVLVSESVIPYEIQRVSTAKDGSISLEQRGDKPSASGKLLNRFKHASKIDTSTLGIPAFKVQFGALLSGEKLIDNIDFRDQLKEIFPDSIGGEMEGYGLYSTAARDSIDWIVVKAICDFADGKKRQSKKEKQDLASHNAVKYVQNVLSDPRALAALNINPLVPSSQSKEEDGVWWQDDSYVSRGNEYDLRKELEEGFVLLLTGISLCGKSELARKLTKSFESQGFLAKRTTDIGDAERFLGDTGKRIVLLEDPFGHTIGDENRLLWHKASGLVSNTSREKLLIITSRIEVLFNIKQTHLLSQLLLDQTHWHDLTLVNRNTLIELWKRLCTNAGLPVELIDQIVDYLQTCSEKELLQPGHLVHLAHQDRKQLIGASVQSLCSLARFDSRDLAIELKTQPCWEILLSLGLMSDTLTSVGIPEIEFVMGSSTNLPGLLPNESNMIALSRRKEFNAKLPRYKEKAPLRDTDIESLNFLESRGLISSESGCYLIRHPAYVEVAKHLISLATTHERKVILTKIQKALATISSSNSILCSKLLQELVAGSEDLDWVKGIVSFAADSALRSIFPAIRDRCMQVVMQNWKLLSINQRTEIEGAIGQGLEYPIVWMGDVPFINYESTSISEQVIRPRELAKDANKIFKELADTEKPSPQLLWSAANVLNALETPVSETGIRRILASDESFIRGIASMNFMAGFSSNPIRSVAKSIFSDESPFVIVEGLLGFFYFIDSLTEEDRAFLTEIALESLKNPLVAVRANNFMTTFGIGYGDENIHWYEVKEEVKPIYYAIWAQLFPTFLESFPGHIRFRNSGRLWQTFDNAPRYLSQEIGLSIAESYLRYLLQNLDSREFDTHELAILKFVFKVSTTSPSLRYSLTERILSVGDTGFCSISLSIAISFWEQLTLPERGLVLKLISSEREDLRWLQAVSITGYSCPDEVQTLILGETDYLSKTPKEILEGLSESLLIDCLTIFSGHPQPIWWYGLHGRGRIWIQVMKEILRNLKSPGFQIALKALLEEGANSFDDEWQDGMEIWETLCSQKEDKQELIDRLISATVEIAGHYESVEKMWEILIKNCKGTEFEERLLGAIVENLEGFGGHYDGDKIYKFLMGEEYFIPMVLPLIPDDLSALEMLLEIEDVVESKEFGTLLDKINQFRTHITNHPPKLIQVSKRLDSIKNRADIPIEALKELKWININHRDIASDLRQKYRDLEQYDLPNWVGLHKTHTYNDSEE